MAFATTDDPPSPNNPRRTMPLGDPTPFLRELPVESPYRAPLDTDDLARSIASLLKREVYEPVLPCRITSIADSLWMISDADGRILRMSTKPLLASDLLIDDATEFGATITFGSPPPTFADILREGAEAAPVADTTPITHA